MKYIKKILFYFRRNLLGSIFSVIFAKFLGKRIVLFTKFHPIYSDFFYSKEKPKHIEYVYFDMKYKNKIIGKILLKICDILHIDAASYITELNFPNIKIIVECEGLAKNEWFHDSKINKVIFQSKYAGRKQLIHPKAILVYPGFNNLASYPNNKSSKKITLLSVGFGSFIKGFDVSYLIYKALKDLGYPVRLIIAGSFGHNYDFYPEVTQDAYEEAGFKEILNESQYDNDLIIRPFSREELINKIYKEADIYLHFARMETFGYSILEAMSFGLPIISVKFKAIPELVEHQTSGFLCNPFEWDGVSPINEMLMNTSEWKDNCFEEGLAYVKNLLEDKNMLDKVSANAKEKSSKFSFEKRSELLREVYRI